MHSDKKRKSISISRARELVAQCESSEMGQDDFCKTIGLSVGSISRYKRRIAKYDRLQTFEKVSPFVEVKCSEKNNYPPKSSLSIYFENRQCELRLKGEVNKTQLSNVVEVLSAC